MSTLQDRSGSACEICTDPSATIAHDTDADTTSDADRAVWLCETCDTAARGTQALEGARWRCLQGSIWSEVPAVQVVSYRLLHRLQSESWAVELLEQAYLDDETLAWAQQGVVSDDPTTSPVDSNGVVLKDGDSVTLIKDLVVKGANFTAKRGTMVKNIRVGDDPTHIEGRVNKMSIMLKTEFLKRAG